MATVQVYRSKGKAQRARARALEAAYEATVDTHTSPTREGREAASQRLERITRMLESIDRALSEV